MISKQIIMSKSEILLTKASEWIIIGAVVLINLSIHLYVLLYSPVRLLVQYHENPPTKEEYCSNETLIFIIAASAIYFSRSKKVERLMVVFVVTIFFEQCSFRFIVWIQNIYHVVQITT